MIYQYVIGVCQSFSDWQQVIELDGPPRLLVCRGIRPHYLSYQKVKHPINNNPQRSLYECQST